MAIKHFTLGIFLASHYNEGFCALTIKIQEACPMFPTQSFCYFCLILPPFFQFRHIFSAFFIVSSNISFGFSIRFSLYMALYINITKIIYLIIVV